MGSRKSARWRARHEEIPEPEAVCARYAWILRPENPEHADAEQRARVAAKWIVAHPAEIERALVEEVADTDPKVVPFLLTAGMLDRARRNALDLSSGKASARWARNRARKKLAAGRPLTEMERRALGDE